MNNYIKGLTGLRFIAASMVFLHHFNPFTKDSFLFNIVSEFHIGVTIFFCLSGFLIGLRYNDKDIELKKYFINRFARIYPVYLLFTIIYFFGNQTANITNILLNITMLKGYFEDYKFSAIAQGWTLTVEETFYVFALLLFWIYRKIKNLVIIIPFFLIIIGIIAVNTIGNLNIFGLFKTYDLLFNYTFLGRSFEFISGFLLSTFISKINFKFKFLTYVGFFVIIISSYILFFQRGEMEFGIRTYLGKMINNILLPSFGVLPVIYGLVKEDSLINRFLSNNFIELLGKSSYAFYIIHLGIISTSIHVRLSNIGILFIILQLFSVIVFKFYEEPMNHFIKNRFLRGK